MRHKPPTPSRGKGPYGRGTTPYDQSLEPVSLPFCPGHKFFYTPVCPGCNPDYVSGGGNATVHKASGFPPIASVLRKAAQAVHGPRQEAYGPPEVNHGRTAALWQAYLDGRSPGPLTAEDVCWMSILVKMSRQMHEHSEDNLVDVAGYVENIALVRGSE